MCVSTVLIISLCNVFANACLKKPDSHCITMMLGGVPRGCPCVQPRVRPSATSPPAACPALRRIHKHRCMGGRENNLAEHNWLCCSSNTEYAAIIKDIGN